jgi:hypothetical protein
MATSNLTQFQRYVWESLPLRKEAVGQEMVYDAVILAVQLWPVELLSQAEPEQVAIVLNALCRDIRRMLCFVYGDERFQGYWILGMHRILPTLVDLTHEWWKRRKDNQAKIAIWRRKWVVE